MTDKLFKFKPLKSSRDNIKLRKVMEDHVIPAMGTTVFVGRTGSGKTNIIANLLKDKNLVRGFFDLVYVFCLSPCTMLFENCPDVKESHTFTDGNPEKLQMIIDSQRAVIENDGYEVAPKILFIIDDMIAENRFMNSRALKELFYQGTHLKTACYITAQSYVKVPKSLRTNCHFLLLFHGCIDSEIGRLEEEHRPPQLTKEQFINMVNYAIKEPYSFIYCDCTIPDKTRKFRKGFGTILKINN